MRIFFKIGGTLFAVNFVSLYADPLTDYSVPHVGGPGQPGSSSGGPLNPPSGPPYPPNPPPQNRPPTSGLPVPPSDPLYPQGGMMYQPSGTPNRPTSSPQYQPSGYPSGAPSYPPGGSNPYSSYMGVPPYASYNTMGGKPSTPNGPSYTHSLYGIPNADPYKSTGPYLLPNTYTETSYTNGNPPQIPYSQSPTPNGQPPSPQPYGQYPPGTGASNPRQNPPTTSDP
uniref:AlNc14C316G10534 protein n=1 Tax=Albugo laibachii Nc14 TaxID=890382 RepID=F0WW96_9STRA|nr:AlNc14C316G10534 [Albugo laibachii Nc14]|eukprot:CCA25716.1 AlNc14C316G10534 [Albugo laibachii Nc14]